MNPADNDNRRIKVSGYLYPYDLPDDHLDLADTTGLSEFGHQYWSRQFGGLDDLEFELEGEEPPANRPTPTGEAWLSAAQREDAERNNERKRKPK